MHEKQWRRAYPVAVNTLALSSAAPTDAPTDAAATPHSPPAGAGHWLVGLAFAGLGAAGMAAIWTLLALLVDRHCAWVAVIAAADIALLLRLTRARPGAGRAWLVVLATLATILAANWGIASVQLGSAFGYGPFDALGRMGPHFAWTLAGLANQAAELGWYAAAVALAVWLGR